MWPWVGQRLKQCGRKDAEQAYGNLRNETTKRNNETTKRKTDETTKANNESKQRKQTTKQRNETKRNNETEIWLPFCSDILLKLWKVVTLCRLKSEELVSKRTWECVEETLSCSPPRYLWVISHSLAIHFFFLLSWPSSRCQCLPCQPPCFYFQQNGETFHLGTSPRQRFELLSQWKSQLNLSKFETLAISLQF